MGVEGRVSLQPDTKARSPNVKQLEVALSIAHQKL